MLTRVEEEVWDQQRCSGCGLCVATCSKGVLYWGSEQHPLREQRQKALGLSRLPLRTCEVCQRFCELCCPRLDEPASAAVGEVTAACTAGVAQSGTPNDVIRNLLVAARAADLIDGVLMPDMDPWTLQPIVRIATTVGEIVSGLGMQHLWVPVLSSLNTAVFDSGLKRLAVVGAPCVAEALSRLRQGNNTRLWPYREAIRLSVASFCTGVYMPHMVSELLDQAMGIERHQIRDLTISVAADTLTASLWDGTERKVPLTEIKPFTRDGCGRCSDYLGQSADVAVGSLGAPAGYATLITRTAAGQLASRHARDLGLLQMGDGVNEDALKAAQMEKDRRLRAQAFDELRIMTLAALADPTKQAEVKKQFVLLFGASESDGKKTEVCHVTCSGC